MWVHPSTGVVLPGQTETVHFSLLVDGESAGALNTGEEGIEGQSLLPRASSLVVPVREDKTPSGELNSFMIDLCSRSNFQMF